MVRHIIALLILLFILLVNPGQQERPAVVRHAAAAITHFVQGDLDAARIEAKLTNLSTRKSHLKPID